jgi:hypothetical protein
MKRNKAIILVLVIIALVQMACSIPQPQTTAETPVVSTVVSAPTDGPIVITATPEIPTQTVPPTQPPATATTAPPSPTATTAPSSGNNNNSSAGNCSFLAAFVSDVTIPDDTRVAPGASFTKTWRVRNDGTCTWGPGLALNALAFTGGNRLGGPDQISLPANVGPGQSIDLSINMVAPASAGVYTSEWKFRVVDVNGVGPYIGLGSGKVAPLYARIIVGATAIPTTAPGATTRIEFASGTTGAGVDGSVKAGSTRSYILSAAKGQLLMASFSSAAADLKLRIVESATGKVLITADGTSTQTFLPANGDYLIQLLGGSADANFTLGVTIPRTISFAAGTYSASVDGKITGRQPVFYLLRAQVGQTMTVKLTSPSNGVVLTIYGLQDGQPLVRSDFGLTEWTGDLNVTQDYIIIAMPSVDSTTFSMTVTIK